jgi:hypothetical protein
VNSVLLRQVVCVTFTPNYQKIQLWITLGARSNPQQCVFLIFLAMMKMWFILLGVLLLVGVVIFLVICGKTNCFAGGKSPSPASNRF